MNEGEDNQSQGVVKDFARRMASKPKKNAQLDLGGGGGTDIDELFKPDDMGKHKPGGMGKHKPPMDMEDDLGGGLGDELGDELGEEKSEIDKIKDHIEEADLSPEDLDELTDYITEKRVDLTDDDIDTEMDRGEAEEKDHMRKDDEPLGGEGNAMGMGGGMSGGGTAPKATGTPV